MRLSAAEKTLADERSRTKITLEKAAAETASQRKIAQEQQAKVDTLNARITDEIKSVEAKNVVKLDEVRAAATKQKDQAVQRAVDAAKKRHDLTVQQLSSQINAKEAQIKHHANHAKTADSNFAKLALRETETANKHAQELRDAQAQIETARQEAIRQGNQIEDLARQLRELHESGAMKSKAYQEQMRTVSAESAKQRELVNNLTQYSGQLAMRAQQREVGFAEQQRLLHVEAGHKIQQARANMEKASRDKTALLEARYDADMKQKDVIAKIHDKMHGMLFHMQKNPGDTEVLATMRQQTGEYSGEAVMADLLRQAEGIHTKHIAQPPRQAFVTLDMPTEEKMDVAGLPTEAVMAGKRKRSGSVVVPDKVELRAKRGRHISMLEDAMERASGAASAAMVPAQKAPGKILVQQHAPEVVQNLYNQFNENPGIDAKALVGRMVVNVEDRSKANVAIETIQQVQEGLKEAETETAANIATLNALPAEEAKKKVEEMTMDAYFAMLDAKKRAEMLKFEETGPTAQNRDQLEVAIAKDNAKHEKVLTDLQAHRQQNIDKYGEPTTSGPLTFKAGEEEQYTADHFARLAKYEQEAIQMAKQAVERVKVEPVVAAQIVSERMDKIKQAAKRDRIKVKDMKKETVGPETKLIVSKQATVNFQKALEFVQKAWWEVDPHFLSSNEMKTIQTASQAQGLTIHSMVKNQVNRVRQKVVSVLKVRGLKKYSLTSNTPSRVEAAVQNAPFSGLPVQSLNSIVDSYLGITQNATPIEQATPVFRIAGTFVFQIKDEIQKQEAAQTAPSQVAQLTTTRRREEPRRIKVHGRGLSKKPTSKPRKKRSRKGKKTPKVAKKDPKPTALQKWKTHKRTKMRL